LTSEVEKIHHKMLDAALKSFEGRKDWSFTKLPDGEF